MFKTLKIKAYEYIYKISYFSIWIRIAIFAFIIIFIYLFFMSQILNDILDNEKKYSNEIKKLSTQILQKNTKNMFLAKKQTIYYSLANVKNKKSTEIFKFVDEICQKNNLNLESIKPIEKDVKNNFNLIENVYKINVNGTYINLIRFLKDVSESPMFIFISDFILENADTDLKIIWN